MRSQVQLHLNGVQQLIFCCESGGIPLTHGLKRAIFWCVVQHFWCRLMDISVLSADVDLFGSRQDLNAVTVTGTVQTLNHTTFSEMHWKRSLVINLYMLPPGFLGISHMLTGELIEIIKDVHAFQRISDTLAQTVSLSPLRARSLSCRRS